MSFIFDERSSDSPFVESVWRTYSVGGGSFMSSAASHWEMVLTRQKGKVTFSIRGPETKASPAPIPEDAEFIGIIFKRGGCWPPYQIHLDGEMLNLQPSVCRLFISNHP
jgi:hypothetical protein